MRVGRVGFGQLRGELIGADMLSQFRPRLGPPRAKLGGRFRLRGNGVERGDLTLLVDMQLDSRFIALLDVTAEIDEAFAGDRDATVGLPPIGRDLFARLGLGRQRPIGRHAQRDFLIDFHGGRLLLQREGIDLRVWIPDARIRDLAEHVGFRFDGDFDSGDSQPVAQRANDVLGSVRVRRDDDLRFAQQKVLEPFGVEDSNWGDQTRRASVGLVSGFDFADEVGDGAAQLDEVFASGCVRAQRQGLVILAGEVHRAIHAVHLLAGWIGDCDDDRPRHAQPFERSGDREHSVVNAGGDVDPFRLARRGEEDFHLARLELSFERLGGIGESC